LIKVSKVIKEFVDYKVGLILKSMPIMHSSGISGRGA
jgi:hypothetical protein